jgi:hypothetical protein
LPAHGLVNEASGQGLPSRTFFASIVY